MIYMQNFSGILLNSIFESVIFLCYIWRFNKTTLNLVMNLTHFVLFFPLEFKLPGDNNIRLYSAMQAPEYYLAPGQSNLISGWYRCFTLEILPAFILFLFHTDRRITEWLDLKYIQERSSYGTIEKNLMRNIDQFNMQIFYKLNKTQNKHNHLHIHVTEKELNLLIYIKLIWIN